MTIARARAREKRERARAHRNAARTTIRTLSYWDERPVGAPAFGGESPHTHTHTTSGALNIFPESVRTQLCAAMVRGI